MWIPICCIVVNMRGAMEAQKAGLCIDMPISISSDRLHFQIKQFMVNAANSLIQIYELESDVKSLWGTISLSNPWWQKNL